MGRSVSGVFFGLAARGALVSVGGGRADLRRADLRRADLRRADLRRADLRRADLRRADLIRQKKTAILTDGSFRNTGTYTGDASPMCRVCYPATSFINYYEIFTYYELKTFDLNI